MPKTIPALAVATMIAAMSTSAFATEWIECGDAADEAQIGFLLGGLDFSEISRAHMRVGDQWWSTDTTLEPGEPLTVADYFFDWKELYATVSDAEQNVVLGELRVFVVSNDHGDAKGGVLSVPGKGVWAVACEGP